MKNSIQPGKGWARTLLSLTFLFTINSMLIAQMNSWVMPPFKFNAANGFAMNASALYPGAPSTGAYNLSNGVYDYNGNLLFYVQDVTIRNPNGSMAGTIGTYGCGLSMGGELVIVPVPSECSKYYLIYSCGSEVLYTIVDCSGGIIQIDKGNGYGNSGTGYDLDPNSTFPYFGIGLAASKKTANPNGPGFIYYLYMVNSGQVYYSVIGNISAGINVPTLIYSNSSLPLGQYGAPSTEVELSENGQYLAYNGLEDLLPNGQGMVEVLNLPTPTSAQFQALYTSPSSIIFGLELVGSGTPDLYVAGEKYYVTHPTLPDGLFDKMDIQTSAVTQLQPSSGAWPYAVTRSFLEYSKGGKICYICNYNNHRYLMEYNPTSGTFNSNPLQIDATGLDVTPHGVSGQLLLWNYDYVFILPDQIDGEDYNNFSSIPAVILNQVDINGMPTSYICGTWVEVYNCAPIIISKPPLKNGVACSYKIEYTEVTPECQNVMDGLTYTSDWIAGDLPAGTDLRNFYDYYSSSFFTHPGYFRVTLKLMNCCGLEVSQELFIRVLDAIPSVMNLQLFNNTPGAQTNYAPTHNINNAQNIPMGTSSVGFLIPNTTGNIQNMNVQVVEVNSAGNPVGSNIINLDMAMNNVTSVGTQNLNTYCADNSSFTSPQPGITACNVTSPVSYPGHTGYFAANVSTVLQKYYRLTVTLSNSCSSTTEWSYFYMATPYNRPTGLDSNLDGKMMSVYPNPSNGILNIELGKVNGKTEIVMTNATGQIVYQEQKDFSSASNLTLNLEKMGLSEGIYFLKTSTNGTSNTQKVIYQK